MPGHQDRAIVRTAPPIGPPRHLFYAITMHWNAGAPRPIHLYAGARKRPGPIRSEEGDSAVIRAWTLVLSVALSGAVGVVANAAASEAGAAKVTDKRLLNAASEPSQWMTYGGTYSEQRFSALKKINKDNVKELGLAWFADYDTNLQQAGTPLSIDGVLYVSTAWSKVYAFDARTGKQLWKYDPKTPGQWIAKVCCGIVNRGIAAYNGKIFIGTLDGRLVALDAKTGKESWSTLTIDKTKHYSITSAPRIAKGKVFIGNSGGEYRRARLHQRVRRRDRQARLALLHGARQSRRRASRTRR